MVVVVLDFMGLAAERDEVQGWGVERGDPIKELARRISSDIGRELLRGAISYLECKVGNSAGLFFLCDIFAFLVAVFFVVAPIGGIVGGSIVKSITSRANSDGT